jgi:hypothetical protein
MQLPPEDKLIEDFRAHVFDRAGGDGPTSPPRSRKLLDGIDIRDTLRHWYEEQST